ncbi:uncharacterized protein PRCAT00001635001 [Priceomyces carsonii]|uniref:uncharacterized protein n=1 Tax=Priceomyces carsonii TaxID=28549 RepID=UPI002EDA40B2|nr:unnamed protein product [Priceomyces carsonii]
MIINYIQLQISSLLASTGIDECNLKIVICALLSFPFNGIFKRLPDQNYTLKHIYILGVSSIFIFVILQLGSGLRTLLISSIGCYFITRYLTTPYMPWVNFLFLMTHLFHNHINAQFFNEYDPTKVDILGAQMVMVMKLSGFGWNVYDARQPKDSLTPYARSRMVKKHPNILPFLSYVFYYASLLTGPAFDYADYDKFIHATLFDDVPESKRPGKGKRKIPRSFIVSMKKTFQGFFWAILLIQSPKYVNVEYVLDGRLYAEHYFTYRIFYYWVLGFSYRLKYYTIWLIAEGACILGGIGYNGYDAETDSFRWNAVQNIDPYAFETGQNVHVCLEAWNMNTNKWLKNYVYMRVAKPGKKPGFKSTLFTFTTSAIWHGTRPGYYMVFVMGAFMQSLGKIYRRNLRPIFLQKDGKTPKKSKKYYDIVCYLTTQLTFGFVVQPFVILDFKKSIYAWSICYFYVQIAIFVTFFLFKGPYGKKLVLWCKRHQDVNQLRKEDSKKIFTKQENEKIQTAIDMLLASKDMDLETAPPLGIPSIETLQSVDKEELESYVKELSDVWASFKNRDSELGGLRDAYNSFATEVNEIYQNRKEELMKMHKT